LNKDIWKTVELVVTAKKGKSHQVTRSLLHKFKENANNVSTRIDIEHPLIVSFVYKSPKDLYDIIQDIKNIPYVKDCRLAGIDPMHKAKSKLQR